MSPAEIKKTVIVASHVTFARNKINNLTKTEKKERKRISSIWQVPTGMESNPKNSFGNFSPLLHLRSREEEISCLFHLVFLICLPCICVYWGLFHVSGRQRRPKSRRHQVNKLKNKERVDMYFHQSALDIWWAPIHRHANAATVSCLRHDNWLNPRKNQRALRRWYRIVFLFQKNRKIVCLIFPAHGHTWYPPVKKRRKGRKRISLGCFSLY